MEVNNLKFVVSKNGEIDEIEEKILIEAYRNLFIKMYGADIVDAYLAVTKTTDKDSIAKVSNKAKKIAENYNKAINVLDSVKRHDDLELLLIFDEEDTLIGGGRLKTIDDKEASIADIAIGDEYTNKRDVWKEAVKYVEGYFAELGFSKMYIEIPLDEGPLLVRAGELGFTEDPEDIVRNIGQRTYLLNKYIERVRDFESDISRK